MNHDRVNELKDFVHDFNMKMEESHKRYELVNKNFLLNILFFIEESPKRKRA